MVKTTADIYTANPRRLARILELVTTAQEVWRPEELRAILQCQLAAPVPYQPDRTSPASGGAEPSEGAQPIRSLGDLFQHPHPPMDLLQHAKEFAKAQRHQAASPLPPETATALYLLSIAAALVHGGTRITELDDQELGRSFDWAVDQSWFDPPLKALLTQARQLLAPRSTTP